MLEVKAWNLKSDDEFTVDGGATWHVVKLVREAARGTKYVVITKAGKEVILNSDQNIVVKL